MINLWDYNVAKKVRIITKDNILVEGKVIELCEAEEQSDLCPQEDSICVELDTGQPVDVFLSEIKEIKAI